MSFKINPLIQQVEPPPISEAMTWVSQSPSNRALINLCQAVPSYPPANELADEVARLAHEPATGLYTDILGTSELRSALASNMGEDYRAMIAPEQVGITAGCNQAFVAAMMVLAGAADNVILPVPYYFNHHMWLEMLKIEPRYLPAIRNGSVYPRASDAERLIDARTRAIVLCSPNNPTGAIYPPAIIDEFFELARKHSLALVIDETYKDFRDSSGPPHDLFSHPEWSDTFVQLYSFSKVFALTGYRVGSIIASGNFLAELEKVLDCIAICAPHISQGAALFGLRALAEWKAEKLQMMAARAQALKAALARADLRYELMSVGAYFAYLRHPFSGTSAKAVAQRLARHHDLLCLPGSMFGPNQDGYLRLAFANVEAELMPEVAARLIESQREID
jgi:aspartate/methionine/tyrosine aminotransferase